MLCEVWLQKQTSTETQLNVVLLALLPPVSIEIETQIKAAASFQTFFDRKTERIVFNHWNKT